MQRSVTFRRIKRVGTFSLAAFVSLCLTPSISFAEHIEHATLYRSLDDLHGKIIAVKRDTIYYDYLSLLPDSSALLYGDSASLDEGISLVRAGSAAASIMDRFSAEQIVMQNSDMAIIDQPIASDVFAFVLPKDSEYKAKINDALAQLKASGTVDRIIERWSGDNLPTSLSALVNTENYDGLAGTFTYCHASEFVPMSYTNSSKSSLGAEVEIALNIAYLLNMEFKATPMNFEDIIPNVRSGNYVMGGGLISATKERAQVIDFTAEHSRNDVVLVVKKADITSYNGEYNSFAELAGKKIGTREDSIAHELAEKSLIDPSYIFFPSYEEMADQLLKGNIDGAVMEYYIAQMRVNETQGLTIMPGWLSNETLGLMLKDNSPYTEKVNEAIRAFKEDGTLLLLSDKWMTGNADKANISDFRNDLSYTKENGTLRIGYNELIKPLSYTGPLGRPRGLLVDLCTCIAHYMNMGVEFVPYNHTDLLDDLSAGKIDISCNNYGRTLNREQEYDVSEPYTQTSRVMVVRSADYVVIRGPIDYIKTGFEQTFLNSENRILIARAIGYTLLVSVGGFLIGVVFALPLTNLLFHVKFASRILKPLTGFFRYVPLIVIILAVEYLGTPPPEKKSLFASIALFAIRVACIGSEKFFSNIHLINHDQVDAVRALGFARPVAAAVVYIPQMFSLNIQFLRNQFWSMYAMSSVLGLAIVPEITTVFLNIQQHNTSTVMPLIFGMLTYLLVGSLVDLVIVSISKQVNPLTKKRRKYGEVEK